MQYNEYVMTAIRTQWGISEHEIQKRFGEQIFQHFQNRIIQIPNDWIVLKNQHVTTTQKGGLFADAIAEKLFI